jgi:hypothetical protein
MQTISSAFGSTPVAGGIRMQVGSINESDRLSRQYGNLMIDNPTLTLDVQGRIRLCSELHYIGVI